MRLLYVLRSVAHFSYHESVIRHLCANGYAVQLLFDPKWSEGFSDTAVLAFLSNAKGLTVGWSIQRHDLWRQASLVSRELLSYSSYLNRKDQSEFYLKRWQGYLPPHIQRLAARSKRVRAILASNWVQSQLRAFERLVPPDAAITRWLRHNWPDVVVASPIDMRFSEEVEYVKAAKALHIPTVVPVLSWDNLTTKGLFHVIPDLTLVWNRTQFNEAAQIHRVPPDKMVITGSPFFDKWFEAKRLGVERGVFCRKVGLDPQKPFLVYLGSSANIAADETWLVRELAVSLRRHPNPDVGKTDILVRPHPANAQIYRELNEEQVHVWPRDGALPESEESIQDFYNTLHHCVLAVGINTSGMIDAVVADKPCVTIMTERYKPTQLQATHFQHLLDSDVLEIAKSSEECADVVERLWRGMDSKRAARQRFVRDFVRPRGLHRSAGAVVAQAIELAALGRRAPEIDAEIAHPKLATEAGRH